MKGISLFRAAFTVCLWMGLGLSWATAQSCAWPQPADGNASLLAVLTGRTNLAGPPIVARADDSLGSDDRLALLVQGDYAAAAKSFRLRDTACGHLCLRLAADYAHLYQGTTPLFPGFNGGFYNFLKDSLHGGEKLSLQTYDLALGALFGWVKHTNGKSAVALELFGDLLYRHPDRLLGNYFGCLTYLRAGLVSEGVARDAFSEKAIYALESPAAVRRRFDTYRFTQLRKAMEADIAAKDIAADPANSLSVQDGQVQYVSAQDGGSLLPLLIKARAKTQEVGPKTFNKYGQEVDQRKVKADTTFNLYALLMIGTVVGAVIFFWVKIRRATRNS
jgi:hypothetical protein